MIKLIGIAGNGIGAGKSTVAQFFIDKGYTRKPFAAKLKESIIALDPVIDHENIECGVEGVRVSTVLQRMTLDEAKREYPELRRLLQYMGTEVGRKLFGENFWVDQALENLDGHFVIDDVRYPNEAEAIHNRGGILIFVERLNVESSLGHSSEAFNDALRDMANIQLYNDGSVQDLHKKLNEEYGWVLRS